MLFYIQPSPFTGTTLHIKYVREENQNKSSFTIGKKMITKTEEEEEKKESEEERQRQETETEQDLGR